MSYYDSCCNPRCCNPCCNPCQSNPCCSCNCGGSAASGTQPAFICANGTMNDFARCTLARYDQLSYDLHNDSKMNHGNIMTEYEAKFSSMGNPICKLIAKRR